MLLEAAVAIAVVLSALSARFTSVYSFTLNVSGKKDFHEECRETGILATGQSDDRHRDDVHLGDNRRMGVREEENKETRRQGDKTIVTSRILVFLDVWSSPTSSRLPKI